MKKLVLLAGVFLFVIGSGLILGAYFVFNQYSMIVSHEFEPYAGETWQFPKTPVELGEGDKVIAKMSKAGDWDGSLHAMATSGENVVLSNTISDTTVYYYVPASDFYYYLIHVGYWGPGSGVYEVALNIMVVSKAPNLMFLLIGLIVLLAGAATTPIAFLYKNNDAKKNARSGENEQHKLR